MIYSTKISAKLLARVPQKKGGEWVKINGAGECCKGPKGSVVPSSPLLDTFAVRRGRDNPQDIVEKKHISIPLDFTLNCCANLK